MHVRKIAGVECVLIVHVGLAAMRARVSRRAPAA
jgi:hypothetical protein